MCSISNVFHSILNVVSALESSLFLYVLLRYPWVPLLVGIYLPMKLLGVRRPRVKREDKGKALPLLKEI